MYFIVFLVICSGCIEPVKSLDSLTGHTIDNILQRYGNSDKQAEFDGTKAFPGIGIRRPIAAKFAKVHTDKSNNVVKELTWYGKTATTNIWFHYSNGQWIVLDAIRWNNNVRF